MKGEAESTRILARIIGPVMVAAGLLVIVRRGELRAIVDAFAEDAALGVVAGLTSLIAGLVVLVFHSRFSSVAALVVTLLGWVMAIRGLVLLFAPSTAIVTASALLDAPYGPEAVGAGAALFGAWLSTVGYSAKPPPIAS